MHTAFSRDQLQKIYVWHRMIENGAEIWKLIGQEKAHFYICGDAKIMAKDIHSTMIHIIRDHGERSMYEAENYVKEMENQKRYSVDVWS